MSGIVANELLESRDGPSGSRTVSVDTDHAPLWLACVGMSKRNGKSVRELAKDGELGSIFPKDLEGGIFGTPLRLRAAIFFLSLSGVACRGSGERVRGSIRRSHVAIGWRSEERLRTVPRSSGAQSAWIVYDTRYALYQGLVVKNRTKLVQAAGWC